MNAQQIWRIFYSIHRTGNWFCDPFDSCRGWEPGRWLFGTAQWYHISLHPFKASIIEICQMVVYEKPNLLPNYNSSQARHAHLWRGCLVSVHWYDSYDNYLLFIYPKKPENSQNNRFTLKIGVLLTIVRSERACIFFARLISWQNRLI